MQSGLISVIVPVYNAEEYLEDCVRSIIEQSYEMIEIILIDDGSLDNSSIICAKLAENNKKVKVINKANGGASSARNAGLEVAKGEYVAFVDSDDKIIDIDMYKKLHEHITKTNADICVCGYIELYLDYTRTIKVPYNELISPSQLWEGFLRDFRSHISIISVPWNKLYRMDFIQADKRKHAPIRFNEDLTSQNDIWFTMNCCAVAEQGILFVDFFPYEYNILNPSSLSKSASIDNRRKVLARMEELMIDALPERLNEIRKTIQCQLFVGLAVLYHRAVVYKQKPESKLEWKTVIAILRNSNNKSEKYSAFLLYVLPKPLYRQLFKIYCKRA